MGTVKPRKNQLNALDLLVTQHDEVEGMIKQLEEGDLDLEKKRLLFRELADNLAAHVEMEEQVFYPAVRAKQTEDDLLESTEEHLSIKRVLADLLETAVDEPRFEPRLSVLKEQIEHHAREEEEKELFPKLRRMMPAEELDALGGEMLAVFEKLMTQEPRLEVPKQTNKPARI